MQVTEKTRKEILFALPELPLAEAEKIATINSVSVTTVYRHWDKIKTGKANTNSIILGIAELAASKKKEAVKSHKRWLKVQQQLSEDKAA